MARVGRYELGPLLGRGGQGEVFAATLRGPGEFELPVALKVLPPGASGLRREARIGGLLRHQNLVDVFEVGKDGDRWFCAMEQCDGSIADYAPLPARAVVEVGLAICSALQYAHDDLGLIHLDLKPENLLFHDGTIKVADLGISRARGFDWDGRIRGTPGSDRAGLGAVEPRRDPRGWAADALRVVAPAGATARPRWPTRPRPRAPTQRPGFQCRATRGRGHPMPAGHRPGSTGRSQHARRARRGRRPARRGPRTPAECRLSPFARRGAANPRSGRPEPGTLLDSAYHRPHRSKDGVHPTEVTPPVELIGTVKPSEPRRRPVA